MQVGFLLIPPRCSYPPLTTHRPEKRGSSRLPQSLQQSLSRTGVGTRYSWQKEKQTFKFLCFSCPLLIANGHFQIEGQNPSQIELRKRSDRSLIGGPDHDSSRTNKPAGRSNVNAIWSGHGRRKWR